MPVKIRLQRHGKKGKPYYWIVAADGRSKRDGRYLEKLGAYNPNTNPATIELDIDGAVKWMNNGAQPTDTARAILSYKGAMLKKHLAGGVAKGALTEEQAEKKFNAWLDEKAAKIQAKVDGLSKTEAEAKAKALEAEKAVNEARMAPPVVEEEVAEEVAEEASTESAVEETAEVAEEATEASSGEVAEETKEVAEVVTEASSEETAEETKVAVEEVTEEVAETAEAKTEEAPAEEAEASNEEE